jgi:hypothetical protein
VVVGGQRREHGTVLEKNRGGAREKAVLTRKLVEGLRRPETQRSGRILPWRAAAGVGENDGDDKLGAAGANSFLVEHLGDDAELRGSTAGRGAVGAAARRRSPVLCSVR